MVIVIAGTGTGVGKTFVAAALARAFGKLGVTCVAVKPVESGGQEDALELDAASTFHVKHDPPYRFQRPVSPHLAARETDTEIQLDTITSWIAARASDADVTVVETAGGLLSPLSPTFCNADIVRAAAVAAWVLVATDRLGVLHDVRAALLAANVFGLAPPQIVLSAPAEPDSATGTNAHELEVLRICRPTCIFSRAEPRDPRTQDAARRLADALTNAQSFSPNNLRKA